MSIIVSDEGSGPKELPPAGLTPCVCAYVEDVGDEETPWGKTQRKVVIGFELEPRMADGRRFLLSKTYTASLNEKATLRGNLELWRGRPFTDSELKGFDLATLKGVNGTATVMHGVTKAGKQRAYIASLAPKLKMAETMLVELEKVPEWIAERRAENAAKVKTTQAGSDPAHDPPHEFDEVPF
jgi:hypothetical protein